MDPFETPDDIEEAALFSRPKWYAAWNMGLCAKCFEAYGPGDTVRDDPYLSGVVGQECCGR